MRMRYRQYNIPEDRLLVGDVRRCTIRSAESTESFYAIVVGVTPKSVIVRRLLRDGERESLYLIRDVGPTGLEYAMFVDFMDTILPTDKIGRKVGKVSKNDLKNIRL